MIDATPSGYINHRSCGQHRRVLLPRSQGAVDEHRGQLVLDMERLKTCLIQHIASISNSRKRLHGSISPWAMIWKCAKSNWHMKLKPGFTASLNAKAVRSLHGGGSANDYDVRTNWIGASGSRIYSLVDEGGQDLKI